MTIAVYESIKPDKALLESNRDEFIKRYEKMLIEIPAKDLVHEMRMLTLWCNNELHEECLFKVQ